MLRRLHEILQASEQLFHTLAVRIDPEHYVKTLQAMRERLHANRDRAVELVGEEKTADYERAFVLGEQYFGERSGLLVRITFERV